MVHFVGAGPGAADLITVRGKRYIEEADVIIYAGSLVNPELLKYAKRDCKIYNSAVLNLDEVVDIIREASAKKLSIVRLHTGDPSIYGAVKEQMDRLDELGIPYDSCPGVSSFLAAAASLNLEYTLPGISQSIILTRAEGRTKKPSGEGIEGFASHGSTMVLFLSAAESKKVKAELIRGGYNENTPVAVVYRASWKDEKKFITILNDLPQLMERESIEKTALIIVGDVIGAKKGDYPESRLYDKSFNTGYRGNKKLYIISCSKKGYELAKKIEDGLKNEKEFDEKINHIVKCAALPEISTDKSLRQAVGDIYDDARLIIFVSAAGIAVRSVAPFIGHKYNDPAILCADDLGENIISLMSGHMGGANEYARLVADITGGSAVITTATDMEGRFAIDLFAKRHGLIIGNPEQVKEFSGAVLAGLYEEGGLFKTDDGKGFEIKISNDVSGDDVKYATDTIKTIRLIPRNLCVGVGCKKNTSKEQIEECVNEAFDIIKKDKRAIKAIGSIDIKKTEKGLNEYAKKLGLNAVFYSAEELSHITGDINGSEFVKDVTGVDNVCERSALLMSGNGRLILGKHIKNGVTVAVAQEYTDCEALLEEIHGEAFVCDRNRTGEE
ncbi:MAG: precorrin-4 C(11)-methyltransferase [Lachnospiraceae bacterium]|nr:precorrin-4 C(11)-methyltransferase [Lachnospiraceae bacterium]